MMAGRNDDPLAPPKGDSEALAAFLGHFRVDRRVEPEALLARVARAFSQIPYENLTKIIRHEEKGIPDGARRTPETVVREHIAFGAGGTCFSLTAAFLHLLRALGWESEPMLADRRYGPNTHSAAIVRIGGRPHLVDPGYLIVDPVPLDGARATRIRTAFNEVELVPRDGGGKIDLYTIQKGNRTYRLTFKNRPADPSEFVRAWDDSFGGEMMRYPVLTRVAGDRQLYVQGRRLQVRGHDGVRRDEIDVEALLAAIVRDFGIAPAIARRALEIVAKREGLRGPL
ncbi:MAG: arylamine N-acetyltransferase [Planctomycetes bacterium]|nr:arylamine N-acetyltransferase [Planctomycetota bacterium]